jgi:hypothetical protein
MRDSSASDGGNVPSEETGVDAFRLFQDRAIEELRQNSDFQRELHGTGIPWGKVKGILKDALPETMADRDSVAYQLVADAMTKILGPQGKAWATERRGSRNTTFIIRVTNGPQISHE